MRTKLSWLLVGAGDIARKRVAPALAKANGSCIAAVCDKVGNNASSLASEYDINTIYTDYKAALNDPDVNAVYIATPVGLHVPMAIDALKAGKHVLVEKPLGLNQADVDIAVKTAASSSLVAGCAYFRRFFPRYLRLKAMLDQNQLGKVVLVRMAYYSWFDPSPGDPKFWRTIKSLSGGGPLSDMGTHMFDMLIGLFGLPVAVTAMTGTLDRNWDVEDSSAIVMRLENEALVTASFNWNSKTWVHMFEVVGTEAKVLWQPCDTGPVVTIAGRDTTEEDMPNEDNVHCPLIEDFVNAVATNTQPAVSFEEAAKTNRLIDAIYRSSIDHREVIV